MMICLFFWRQEAIKHTKLSDWAHVKIMNNLEYLVTKWLVGKFGHTFRYKMGTDNDKKPA
ncbi:hypothetical protein BZG72_12995 [Salinivibrio sp. PR6]|uniref:Group II intron maturase-specific domain-containing protein n=1 Tax=Salinivibrio siamensis TaxID=414286 RepID=A0ABX3K6R0_9GAMM|nr:hypothetical protein WN56_11620 [Salinivibrio sp. KP-1]MPS33528.1 hypothetical protein [Salinivibrio sp. VYel7]OOE68382.1 hypothetical protein BZG20_05510 [Salinivibrio sp. IB868]OOE73132.1 hypothetical protein BZG22_11420 [Salinivibrio sp. IB870]OOE78367.1 hypothetical protein BZG25_12750 [Salinivibrio sp. ML198]OOE80075.1 hypothetical protein BZG72_12995 [Salinivibrio sp. PR6]OOE83114.1 hypothetical protein BZG73_12395 [Salinivibrio siamensis]